MSIFRKCAVGGLRAATLTLAIGPAACQTLQAEDVQSTASAGEGSVISPLWESVDVDLVDYWQTTPGSYSHCAHHGGGNSSLMEGMEAAMQRMAAEGIVYDIIVPQFYRGSPTAGEIAASSMAARSISTSSSTAESCWGLRASA